MAVRYTIHCLSSKQVPSFEIDESYFISIKKAKNDAIKITAIEESLEALLENYLDFEKALLAISVEHSIHSNFFIQRYNNGPYNINRLLVNMLSTTRLYLDFVHKCASYFEYLQAGIKDRIETEISKQYDNRLGYRAMESIRNYSQHFGLPVHHLAVQSSSGSKDDTRVWFYRTLPSISIDNLREDKTFKKAVLKELSTKGDSYPLLPLIRDYIAGIFEIHLFIRDQLEHHIKFCSDSIAKAIDQASETAGVECNAFLLIQADHENDFYERIDIHKRIFEYMNNLISKNNISPLVEFRYVTNQLRNGDT